MRLLAQFQPLYHRSTFLGVSPLAGGEKAKMQLEPKNKSLEKKEKDQHAKQ